MPKYAFKKRGAITQQQLRVFGLLPHLLEFHELRVVRTQEFFKLLAVAHVPLGIVCVRLLARRLLKRGGGWMT